MAKDKPKARRPSEEEADEKRAERIARAQMVMEITVDGTDVSFTFPLWENLPIAFRRRFREETKGRDEEVAEEACCFWWGSRVLAGEDVTLDQVEEDWFERCKGARPGDIKHRVIGGDDPREGDVDSPEA